MVLFSFWTLSHDLDCVCFPYIAAMTCIASLLLIADHIQFPKKWKVFKLKMGHTLFMRKTYMQHTYTTGGMSSRMKAMLMLPSQKARIKC